jgi:DNA-binding GntR family transcriptional regulator
MSDINFAELASAAFQNHKSASEVVADTIRLAILRGHFRPGQMMPQEEFAKQFGVSRAPVRDALRQLEAEGLIVMHPHRGAEVAKLSAEDVEEVFLIRESLETTALRLSVPNMTEEDFSRADAVLNRIDLDPNTAHMAELNWEFHESLYRASRMPKLLGIVRNLNNNALPYHHLGFVAIDVKEISQSGHRKILDACRARRHKDAVSALTEHLRVSRSLMVSHLQKQQAPSASSDPSSGNTLPNRR